VVGGMGIEKGGGRGLLLVSERPEIVSVFDINE